MAEVDTAETNGLPLRSVRLERGDAQSIAAALTQWLFKSAYEAVATPLTYAVVGFLKRREGGGEVFDHGLRFNPLAHFN